MVDDRQHGALLVDHGDPSGYTSIGLLPDHAAGRRDALQVSGHGGVERGEQAERRDLAVLTEVAEQHRRQGEGIAMSTSAERRLSGVLLIAAFLLNLGGVVMFTFGGGNAGTPALVAWERGLFI